MTDDNFLRYTLRIDRSLFNKFRFVSSYYGRSANKELEQIMKKRVKNFEEEKGIITPEDLETIKPRSKNKN